MKRRRKKPAKSRKRAREKPVPKSPGAEGTRRAFFCALCAHLGAIAIAALVKGSWAVVRDAVAELPSEQPAPTELAGLIKTDSVQVYVGHTNIRRGWGPSPYLRRSAEQFCDFAAKATGAPVNQVNTDHPLLRLDPMNCNLVLLGGPVANEIAAELSGYHFQQIRGKQRDKLPVFDRESKKFSWGFFCGDKDFGDFDGLRRSATVFDAGKETRRPLYGLWDLQKDAERPALFSTDDVGFLSQEALLITRVRNPSNSARTVLMIAGAHGYSLLAFCSHLETNLTQLRELRQRQPEQHAYFQAMIPAALNHDQKARLTKAELLWEDAELAKVPSAV